MSQQANSSVFVRYPLTCYFILAYLGSWLIVLPYLRFGNDSIGLLPFQWPIPFPVAATLAPFTGPFLAGFIMTGIKEGRAGIRRLLARFVLWRVGFQWYLFAIVGIPAITVVGAMVLPGAFPSLHMPPVSWILMYPLTFLVTLVIGGPLGEEAGWRGFALPRMQRLQGPLVASFWLGLLWAFWHLPYFWIPQWGTPKETAFDIFWFVLAVVFVTIIYTWAFNNTKESLLIAVLIHASNDAFLLDQIFSDPLAGISNVPLVIGFGITALFIIILTGGRLGAKLTSHT